jgi:hypothetical protein
MNAMYAKLLEQLQNMMRVYTLHEGPWKPKDKKIMLPLCFSSILWYTSLDQELWSQMNSHCQRMALKQHSFLGNSSKTNNGTSLLGSRFLISIYTRGVAE